MGSGGVRRWFVRQAFQTSRTALTQPSISQLFLGWEVSVGSLGGGEAWGFYGYLGVSAPDHFAACCYHAEFTEGNALDVAFTSGGVWGRAYLTLHSMIVPLLKTPNCVYMGFCGFCATG